MAREKYMLLITFETAQGLARHWGEVQRWMRITGARVVVA